MSARPPPDAAVRQAILDDLGSCLVVEAAAGSGKTTCLVGRLLRLLAGGALADGKRLAAVTFTHKAAAELRERLDLALEKFLARPDLLPPGERDNLERAVRVLPECHIGTIHSFCSRLIRERPVEAGVGPEFRGLDDQEDAELRRQAWNEFSDRLRRGGWPAIAQAFEDFGLDAEMLREGFDRFAAYPDIEYWPGRRESAEPDSAAFLAGLDSYLSALDNYLGRREDWRDRLEQAAAGNDDLIPILCALRRRRERRRGEADLRAALSLLEPLKPKPGKVYKPWLGAGFDKEQAEAAHAAYAVFQTGTARPFQQACQAKAYSAVLEAFFQAREIYDRRRREAGGLNFQDLLLGAARLLRDYPRTRAELAERYARLLIDETQDTDPVQAEIMFLLASADPEERDWRACRPRPGSLFIVGDPKQSI
ncbi:MAG: UvrD-helicase domain-containing protein, partial [Planctomycetota bacterium]|nr:UvrD-helicase domain-containing protein [Planctomycetota bacterium]